MLILLFIVLLILGILFIILNRWAENEYYETITFISFGCIATIFVFEIIIISYIMYCIGCIGNLKVADKKIAMYEEENNKIQTEVAEKVKDYQDYEQNTYSDSLKNIDLSKTNIVVLTQLYPELKSDEMVKKQIDIYQENNKKIKEIKEQKINNEVAKWWLYFGNIEEVK